ncbi:MAG: protease modulator HflC [Pseudomonadales bacterium]|nr:protease modulator HflC [Pseudomonadales bacterium]
MSTRMMIVLVLLVIGVALASDAVYTIRETERAVLLRFGALERADLQPGIDVKWPFADVVKRFDARVLTLDSETQRFFTVEKRPLNVDSYVKWRIIDVAKYYTRTSGDERNASDRLAERVRTGLRNQFSRRDVYEVVSGERDELMSELTKSLSTVMQEEFGVEVLDVRVKRIELPAEVSSSVYQRMSTEREVLAREHRARGREMAQGIRADAERQATIIRAEAEKKSEEVRGEGDALATATYAEAYGKDPEFYEFTRSLNAYRRAFSNKDDVLVIDPGSDFFKYLNAPGGD